ncbi:cytochrome c oxidase assembly factor CtaG/putative copper export protein [Rhodococcus sp. SORGH_AS303]|nr:cytochrome c oxidase assembly factor CtaG/putative copper export protein [Rhodococcus sp. SORGH_AS_0303]
MTPGMRSSGDASSRPSRTLSTHVLTATIVVAVGLVVSVTAVSGDTRYLASGDSYPGIVTSQLYVVLRFVAALSGAVTLGALVHALTCTRVTKSGRIGPEGYAALLIAARSSSVWLMSSAALIPVSAADATGIGLGDAVRRGALLDLVAPNEAPKAWMVSAVAALAVVVLTRWTLNWVPLAASAAVSVIGILPAWVIGNAGQGRDHDIGTSAVIVAMVAFSVWTGAAISLRSMILRVDGRDARECDLAVSRHRVVASCAAVLTVGPAIVVAVILLPPAAVFTSEYGRFALVAGALVLVSSVLAVTAAVRRPPSDRYVRVSAQASSVILVSVWALVVLMAVRPAPAFLITASTVYDVFLGFQPTGPPSLSQFASFWRFDFVTGAGAVLLAGLYGWAVVRLRRRGDMWPLGRTVAWASGCLTLLVATSSGVGAYGSAMFGVHMGVHMTLNMFVPVLLVLGGPVTLALRALPAARDGSAPGPREWIVMVVHSPLLRVLSNPAVAVGLFVLSPFAVYFSPLFDELVRYHWGHELMNIHFIVTGYLYYWVIIGIDPGPKRLPHLGRLALLFAAMPFHAFFGIAVMTMDRLIGGTFYRYLDLPWVQDLASDQRFGGGLAWASSEVPLVMVVLALVTQWARQDRKTEVREDRAADRTDDDELAAYNAMLAQLSRTRR